MICKGMPRHGLDRVRSFELGGNSPGVLRKILGEIATATPVEVRVKEWVPALA
jgi:hypothetical protein